MKRSLIHVLVARGLVTLAWLGAPLLAATTVEAAPPSGSATITGRVKDARTGDPLADALVIVQCACLDAPIEAMTNARGIYVVSDLPAGNYTVQVLVGAANVSKVTELPSGARYTANFTVVPHFDPVDDLIVESPIDPGTTSGTKVDVPAIENVPLGNSRDFTDVALVAPTALQTAGGISLAGGEATDTKYTIEGGNVGNPSMGTVGASLIQDFLSEVDIKEAGYDAKYGGASAGQVAARRVAGTNALRGEAGFRFTPRLAQPRLIANTDEALRVTQVGDFEAQAYGIVSGPIVKDRVWFTFGIAPGGQRHTLTQSFYARVDRDASGGYEDCPYHNGDNDCVTGGNYIGTQKFDDQKFKVGNFSMQYIGGLDVAITPRHRLGFTAIGTPTFQRTSYRLPFSIDPNAFGTTPSADPLGGLSRVATGVIDGAFGTTLANYVMTGANYEGRVLADRMEIDAGVNFYQSTYETAWRLDDPAMKTIVASEQRDGQGRSLFDFLDRDGRATSAVRDACNASDLPGIACPVRTWVSGGIGEFGRDVNRRVEARFNATHFFEGAGSHQLEWGGSFSWESRRTRSQYSGRNEPGFTDNCAAGHSGGGEYCYDPLSDSYTFDRSTAVNNHRFVLVDVDNPDNRTTFGYGTVRHEQGDLRALADPLGRGVRADAYDATLSTLNGAAYLQDRWAIRTNLHLNAGVRWELQDMRDVFGNTQILIADNVAPRVGLVYDWTDEGRSRLFASYGWFYQPLPLQLNSRVFGGQVSVLRQFSQNDCATPTTLDGVTHPRLDDYGLPTQYCVDTHASTTGLTRGAIVPRLRGQYNQQFQIGYEQEIVEDLLIGVRWLHTDLGRAVEDVSTNGGQTFIIANPGEPVKDSQIAAQAAQCSELETQLAALPGDADERNAVFRELSRCNFMVDAFRQINRAYTEPTRNYDAWTIHLQKRFARNWMLNASYTYSRLVGNYDGFVDPINGSVNIGASTQYDTPELVRNSYGPLSSNVPHRLKIDGFYGIDLGNVGRLTLGTSFHVQSGFPIQVRSDSADLVYTQQYLVYMLPRGAGGRVQPNYRWNLSAGYTLPLKRDLELEFSARIINVTNAKAVLRVDNVYTFQAARPIAGGELGDLKHAKVWERGAAATQFFGRNIVQPQGNYGVETQFQQPLAAQFELELRF